MAAACGFGGDDDADARVTVTAGTGSAPADMRAFGPRARYLDDSNVVVFVSGPQYSSTCPPSGEVSPGEDGTLTLTVEYDDSNCTADADAYTFRVRDVQDPPVGLHVVEEGRDDLVLDLAS